MLSTSIFSSNGSIYDQAAVFGSQFELNRTALDIVGLPALTGSNAWSNLVSNLSVSIFARKRAGIKINHFRHCADWCPDRTRYLILGPARP